MNIRDFSESNVKIGEHQKEYNTLFAHKNVDGEVTYCFELTAAELKKVSETKEIWLTQLTFNKPFQPIRGEVKKPKFKKMGKQKMKAEKGDLKERSQEMSVTAMRYNNKMQSYLMNQPKRDILIKNKWTAVEFAKVQKIPQAVANEIIIHLSQYGYLIAAQTQDGIKWYEYSFVSRCKNMKANLPYFKEKIAEWEKKLHQTEEMINFICEK